MEIMAIVNGGRVHLRCAVCGTLVADLNPCRVEEPGNSEAPYVIPTPADTDGTIDTSEMVRGHPRDACYRSAKRAREAADADLGAGAGEAPFAWARG